MKRSCSIALLLCAAATLTLADSYDPKLFAEMRWRSVGPPRGGRTRACAGVPSQPNVFYIGAVNGGVWKTDDYGRTWTPIFDDQPTGSIGAIAVAPSDPNIIYVGSGEGLQRPALSVGAGIYKSTDAGKTWTHLGLRDGQQIPQIAVDPRNPNRLFVAVLGHPYGSNEERGIFRSTDGGRTFEKVLYKDENTGGSDVAIDPSHPDTVYAGMWEARQGPWENGSWNGTGGGLFKSTDGGKTWRQLTKGLPEGVTQVNIAIAPSRSSRIYTAVATGQPTALYRSEDSGETWTRTTTDARPAARIGGGDLPVLAVDPKNPEIVYSTSTVTWRSNDAGKTWTGIRGAPGGDDYQKIWINPNNPAIILIASDQGAIISVNNGQTWSSWYNQSTAAMYHVAGDNAFPYRLCSGQQDSGSACVASRGNDGQITFREWHPIGVEEYGYAAPDPLNPDIVYGGKVTRYDRRTGQVENVSPKPIRGADFRALRTAPV
ncbi:MAG TPA: YCF48-related protein, partial [Bryobacteraceae bacterium]|nr:YCF48-related protein [Bryobacteraceae bacterium]